MKKSAPKYRSYLDEDDDDDENTISGLVLSPLGPFYWDRSKNRQRTAKDPPDLTHELYLTASAPAYLGYLLPKAYKRTKEYYQRESWQEAMAEPCGSSNAALPPTRSRSRSRSRSPARSPAQSRSRSSAGWHPVVPHGQKDPNLAK